MEESILLSTKKLLGLAPDYDIFDQDILTHINTAFTILHQLGVGPSTGFYVQGEEEVWADFVLLPGTETSLATVRSYVPLKVKLLFDPPGSSYHLAAMERQIDQLEWRMNVAREEQREQDLEEVIP